MIKEQKLLDAYAIIESYCEVVLERIKQLEQGRFVTEPVKSTSFGFFLLFN